jgi:uncharacterized protein YndB with AHSA1/START domain
MGKRSGRSLQEEILIDAPPTDVYEAWVDPAKIEAWFVEHASGWAMSHSKVTWRFDDTDFEVAMEVVEALPAHRLVLRDEHNNVSRTTDVTFAPVEGKTRVRLTTHGFPAATEFDEEFHGVRRGWVLALATLKYYVEHHYGAERSNLLLMRPAQFEYSDIPHYFTSEEGLASWLSSSGWLGKLTLRNGETMTGRVLARTHPEVLVEWEEIAGVAALKAFSVGPRGRMVGMHVSSWRLDDREMLAVRTMADEALDRLVAVLAPGLPQDQ